MKIPTTFSILLLYIYRLWSRSYTPRIKSIRKKFLNCCVKDLMDLYCWVEVLRPNVKSQQFNKLLNWFKIIAIDSTCVYYQRLCYHLSPSTLLCSIIFSNDIPYGSNSKYVLFLRNVVKKILKITGLLQFYATLL